MKQLAPLVRAGGDAAESSASYTRTMSEWEHEESPCALRPRCVLEPRCVSEPRPPSHTHTTFPVKWRSKGEGRGRFWRGGTTRREEVNRPSTRPGRATILDPIGTRRRAMWAVRGPLLRPHESLGESPVDCSAPRPDVVAADAASPAPRTVGLLSLSVRVCLSDVDLLPHSANRPLIESRPIERRDGGRGAAATIPAETVLSGDVWPSTWRRL